MRLVQKKDNRIQKCVVVESDFDRPIAEAWPSTVSVFQVERPRSMFRSISHTHKPGVSRPGQERIRQSNTEASTTSNDHTRMLRHVSTLTQQWTAGSRRPDAPPAPGRGTGERPGRPSAAVTAPSVREMKADKMHALIDRFIFDVAVSRRVRRGVII
ncbi:hypothetical protein EVAR_78574_1 [Eumeta japonica]|uniref:Uncharacterized protein n=1 Tax=Eumeta variegata TaxID=151549 RepID=A0A4C1W726_EUMVA|nr:hypothetical protein EVAR_78574_1 [Eumeta japonica]